MLSLTFSKYYALAMLLLFGMAIENVVMNHFLLNHFAQCSNFPFGVWMCKTFDSNYLWHLASEPVFFHSFIQFFLFILIFFSFYFNLDIMQKCWKREFRFYDFVCRSSAVGSEISDFDLKYYFLYFSFVWISIAWMNTIYSLL